MLVLTLQSLKMGGHFRVLRGRYNTLKAYQYQRFALNVQYFLVIYFGSCVPGAAFSNMDRSSQKSSQGQHLEIF